MATMIAMTRGLLILLVLGSVPSWPALAQPQCSPGTATATLEAYNVRGRLLNNGRLFWDGEKNLYEAPAGGGVQSVFLTSLAVAGLVNGQLRVAASTYGPPEFWPGPLDDLGRPTRDCSTYDRIWSIRRDDLERFERTGVADRDLASWPTGLGAPTLGPTGQLLDLSRQPFDQRVARLIDLEAGERPALVGEQLHWWIMNDAAGEHLSTGSPSIGIEVAVSAFGFDVPGVLGNATFYQVSLRVPGPALEDAYFGVFFDPEIGYSYDDYAGSDSLRSLAYAYNQTDRDGSSGPGRYPGIPPATGLDFLMTPRLDSSAAQRCGRPAGMTSVVSAYFTDSTVLGRPATALAFSRSLQGRWRDGLHMTLGGNGRDFSNRPVCFIYSGRPPEFWSAVDERRYTGDGIWEGDRWLVAGSGPFRIGAQPEVFLLGLITSFGTDHVDSVHRLLDASDFVQRLFDEGGLLFPSARTQEVYPPALLGAEVFPNPSSGLVRVRTESDGEISWSADVYDPLGRLVRPFSWVGGSETRTLDLSELPEGVYFLRIQGGRAVRSEKLVLLRGANPTFVR